MRRLSNSIEDIREIEEIRLNFPLEVVKVYWDYDPETGEFFNFTRMKVKNSNVGSRYLQIQIPYRGHKFNFYAQRLAVLFMTGKLPPENMDVDHINGLKKDNRWCNLRVVTRSDNMLNLPGRKKSAS